MSSFAFVFVFGSKDGVGKVRETSADFFSGVFDSCLSWTAVGVGRSLVLTDSTRRSRPFHDFKFLRRQPGSFHHDSGITFNVKVYSQCP